MDKETNIESINNNIFYITLNLFLAFEIRLHNVHLITNRMACYSM